MLEECTTIDSCESLLLDQVKKVRLLGQIPLTNNDFEKICIFISDEFPTAKKYGFKDDLIQYPATICCYLVWKGIFNYKEREFWDSIKDEIEDFDTSKSTFLGKLFIQFIEQNGLFYVEIPSSKKYLTPILMHGIIPQNQVHEYFEKIIYLLVTRELLHPEDKVELLYWLEENRDLERLHEEFKANEQKLNREIREFDILNREIREFDTFDLSEIDKKIDDFNQQITLLSNKSLSDDNINELKTTLNKIEIDIQEIERIEQDIKFLEGKKKISSEIIENIKNCIQTDPVLSKFSEKTANIDDIKIYYENLLLEYLEHIAKDGNSEENDDLLQFLIELSDLIENNKIKLSDYVERRYHGLISSFIEKLSYNEDDEIVDITKSHVYCNASSQQNIINQDFKKNQLLYQDNIDTSQFLRTESLCCVEDQSAFVLFDPEIEMGDYLNAHVSAISINGPKTSKLSQSEKEDSIYNLEIYEKISSLNLIENEEEVESSDTEKIKYSNELPSRNHNLKEIIESLNQKSKDGGVEIKNEFNVSNIKNNSNCSELIDKIIQKSEGKTITKHENDSEGKVKMKYINKNDAKIPDNSLKQVLSIDDEIFKTDIIQKEDLDGNSYVLDQSEIVEEYNSINNLHDSQQEFSQIQPANAEIENVKPKKKSFFIRLILKIFRNQD